MDYQPNDTALALLPNVQFVAVIGPTAAGKTTLMNAATARSPVLHQVLTTTSRASRAGEEDGIDAHFRPREEMEVRVARRDYVQVAPSITGDLYATAPEDYTTEGIAMMAVLSDAMPVFEALPFKALRRIYVLPPDWETWQARVAEHAFAPEQLQKRMAEAAHSLQYSLEAPGLVFVVNDDLAQATADFTQAALGAAVAGQDEARSLAASLLQQLHVAQVA